MKIRIETLSDEHDCDTCGMSWADGARVYFDDKLMLDLEPIAYCYGGAHYSDADIYRRILDALGHVVVGGDGL